jgi:hypothetical protein
MKKALILLFALTVTLSAAGCSAAGSVPSPEAPLPPAVITPSTTEATEPAVGTAESSEDDAEKEIVTWLADLTHDGHKETISFEVSKLAHSCAPLVMTDSRGSVLHTTDDIATCKAGWDIYSLYEDETGAYLLEYCP